MHTFLRAIPLIAALALFGLSSTAAFADKIKDAGRYDGTYVTREMLPIPDQDGHALMLTESTGTAVHSGGPLEGFSVVTREIADLRHGNGPHQGYVVFSKGDDQQVVKFEGTVATTMKDGKPNTTMKVPTPLSLRPVRLRAAPARAPIPAISPQRTNIN